MKDKTLEKATKLKYDIDKIEKIIKGKCICIALIDSYNRYVPISNRLQDELVEWLKEKQAEYKIELKEL